MTNVMVVTAVMDAMTVVMTGTLVTSITVVTTVRPTKNAPAPQVAVRTRRNVAPGRHLQRGIWTKRDLQGTMTDEEHMIFEENLTLILIAVGMTVGARRGTTGTTTGLLGRTGITVGDAEIGLGAILDITRLASLWTAHAAPPFRKSFRKRCWFRDMFCWP